MKEQTREEPKIVAAAERQMQAWAYQHGAAPSLSAAPPAGMVPRDLRFHGPHRLESSVRPFVAVSREAGAGGSQVGRLVAERLAWQFYDANLLDEIAQRFHDCRMMLELVDETESNWVYDVLGTWMDRAIIPHEKFVVQLSRVVWSAARKQSCVFVGRGAQFLLPPKRGLAVRLVASPAWRIENIMRSRALDHNAAARFVERVDRGRHDFVERFFRRDICDPHHYDLVINTERVGVERAAEEIVAAAYAGILQGARAAV